jgi:hypothetical protein
VLRVLKQGWTRCHAAVQSYPQSVRCMRIDDSRVA